jgi:hypothetical protein
VGVSCAEVNIANGLEQALVLQTPPSATHVLVITNISGIESPALPSENANY